MKICNETQVQQASDNSSLYPHQSNASGEGDG